MPNLKPNFSYEISNTYVTDSGEGRIELFINYITSEEVDGSYVNTSLKVAEFNFGTGLENPQSVNVESILYSAVPQYFTE